MNYISLANLPTPIIKLEKLSRKYKKNIYVKRDDFTGTEVSGNKVRKLEYCMKEALDLKCDTIITTGGIQSNHCRATAAVCAELGLDCHVILRGKPNYHLEGNLFLDYILGAKVHIIGPEISREGEMDRLKNSLIEKGKKPYLIPVGASNAVGSLGYVKAYEEIKNQEKDLNLSFDTLALSVGSGGTYAGLWYRNQKEDQPKRILGLAVDNSSEEFTREVTSIVQEMDSSVENFDSIEINDKYIGEGYAIATEEEIQFHVDVAMTEGIIFDPCYTGKAFRGLIKEIEAGNLASSENILFIHTGGLQGWTEEQRKIAVEYCKTK